MDEVRSNTDVVYRCACDAVWCPEYRRPVLIGTVDFRLKQIVGEVCAERDAPIVERETTPEHVHQLVAADPAVRHSPAGRADQGPFVVAARPGVPTLAVRAPDLWSNSYFIATVGGAAVDVVKRYVENQRNV